MELIERGSILHSIEGDLFFLFFEKHNRLVTVNKFSYSDKFRRCIRSWDANFLSSSKTFHLSESCEDLESEKHVRKCLKWNSDTFILQIGSRKLVSFSVVPLKMMGTIHEYQPDEMKGPFIVAICRTSNFLNRNKVGVILERYTYKNDMETSSYHISSICMESGSQDDEYPIHQCFGSKGIIVAPSSTNNLVYINRFRHNVNTIFGVSMSSGDFLFTYRFFKSDIFHSKWGPSSVGGMTTFLNSKDQEVLVVGGDTRNSLFFFKRTQTYYFKKICSDERGYPSVLAGMGDYLFLCFGGRDMKIFDVSDAKNNNFSVCFERRHEDDEEFDYRDHVNSVAYLSGSRKTMNLISTANNGKCRIFSIGVGLKEKKSVVEKDEKERISFLRNELNHNFHNKKVVKLGTSDLSCFCSLL